MPQAVVAEVLGVDEMTLFQFEARLPLTALTKINARAARCGKPHVGVLLRGGLISVITRTRRLPSSRRRHSRNLTKHLSYLQRSADQSASLRALFMRHE
jgi:hypothetical protein